MSTNLPRRSASRAQPSSSPSARGVPSVCVPGEPPALVPGRHVAAVDTTGAGDTFCGALATALDQETHGTLDLGALVRAAELVRTPPHDALDPAMEPRPQRRASVGLDERDRHARLGHRVRGLGRLE
ncbi:PfkB family carbohydrate kinase [Arthrobacter sp. BE255]|uniref:PfkB family carbohydrate kinase n=1 Tax=Arthrobacter sp. BE255 TaxID=2817721 RepID=UPI00286B736D|nr:PfkB family carbohydrate kinase [Arthrobacter sp. BE255]